MLVLSSAARSSNQWTCAACKRWLVKTQTRSLRRAATERKTPALPDHPVRTRFAPSPTGDLHLGSLRTALFNYLLARRTGGQFVLRIEDTDKKRIVRGAEERLCEDLRWAGLDWDEGPQVGGPHGPYRQSERTNIYRDHADRLLNSGHAYRCFCSPQRLQELAFQRSRAGLPTDYDRSCASIPLSEAEDRAHRGEKHVIRLKVPEKYPDFHDIVYGRIGKDKKNLPTSVGGQFAYEDPILMKSDGLPTYHLANVVDDHEMRITRVIRGVEWIPSTPKHLFLYEAFGWEPPVFGHVGLLQDKSGRKLSKREHAVDIASFRTLGALPEALVNYVALLGWSHGEKSDVMTLPQLIDRFDLKFTKGNTIMALEKLWFLQKAHAQLLSEQGGKSFDDLASRVYAYVETHLTDIQSAGFLRGKDLRLYVRDILRVDAKNFTTPDHFVLRNMYFFGPVINSHYSIWAANGKPVHEIPIENLARMASQLELLGPERWTSEAIALTIPEIVTAASSEAQEDEPNSDSKTGKASPAQRHKAWNKAFHHYLRWALAEGKDGPGIADIMAILGRDESLARLSRAAALVGSSIKVPKERAVPASAQST